MKDRKNKSLIEKVNNIQKRWDMLIDYCQFMPDREMYCTFDFEDEDEPCDIHGVGSDCVFTDDDVIHSVSLYVNTDWLAWELEMMD